MNRVRNVMPLAASRDDAKARYGASTREARKDLAIFDTVIIDASAAAQSVSTIKLFNVGNGAGKAREQTNIQNGGRMNDGFDLLVSRIEMMPRLKAINPAALRTAAVAEFIRELADRGLFTLSVNGNQRVQDGPLSLFPSAQQLIETPSVAVTAADAVAGGVEERITIRIAGEVYHCEPVMLEAGQSFTAQFDYDAGPLVVPQGLILEVRSRFSGQGWKNA